MAFCVDILRVFHAIGHSIALIQYLFAIYYDLIYVVAPKHLETTILKPGMGGRSRFLTYWCLIIQAIYFSISLLNDVLGTKPSSTLRRVKDYIFASLAFPLALNVAVAFWSLMFIDRELVFPRSFDEFFPSWLNHVMHTNVAIFIFLELYTTRRVYPARKYGLIGLTTLNVAYLTWLHVIKLVSGQWVYPVLEVLALPFRVVFFIVIILFGLSFYFLGEHLNKKFWPTHIAKNKRM